jgi:Protein of unknown function (DUF2950)
MTRIREVIGMSTYLRRRIAAVALLGACLITGVVLAQTKAQRTFPTPEDAVKALVDTVKAGNLESLMEIFGPEGKELIDSSEPAIARQNQQVFTVAVREKWHLEDAAPDRKTLVIGYEDWPFPVPLVKAANGWRFDTAAGKEEVLARRIGRNELAAIDATRAYVTAQRRYAEAGHDGKPAGVHAVKFQSDPGKEDGLYWPTVRGQKRSPLGDVVAQAAAEGRPVTGKSTQPSPFHGYYFKILTAQGAAAPGGARSYIVKGEMSGGFALVAWPAQYDATGIMTFIVNQDGVVREKDLGPGTDAAARKMTAYNPDSSWRVTK